jgi:hypothetical protein
LGLALKEVTTWNATIRRNGKRDLGTIAFQCMGYFDQIMVSETYANGLFELSDIGKQEFTTSHFDTKQRTIQRISCHTTEIGFSDHFPVYMI